MADDIRWRTMVPAPIRGLPADLAAVVALAALTVLAATLPGVRTTPLRVVVGLPFVLFLPGYALVAALFPERGEPRTDESESGEWSGDGGIDGLERVALALGTSIAVTPLIGLFLNFTPWGIRLVPVLLSVGSFTVACAGVAAVRRSALPPEDRFCVPYRIWVRDARAELFRPDTRTDAVLNVLLVVSVLLAVSSVGYAVAVPKEGESFTEFYVLTENESGGLVADDYPTEFVRGQSKPVVIGIGNHEHETVEYSVVAQVQNVSVTNETRVVQDSGGSETRVTEFETSINEKREIGRFSTRVPDNESRTREFQVEPSLTGERLRLKFLLFRGDVPADAGAADAYRDLHLWIDVTESG